MLKLERKSAYNSWVLYIEIIVKSRKKIKGSN